MSNLTVANHPKGTLRKELLIVPTEEQMKVVTYSRRGLKGLISDCCVYDIRPSYYLNSARLLTDFYCCEYTPAI
jgi:hypothetical protein